MGLGFNLGWERQKLRDDAKADAELEAKPAPGFRSRAPEAWGRGPRECLIVTALLYRVLWPLVVAGRCLVGQYVLQL